MKKRVWELDAFRGLCVLGMVIVHFVYDLIDLYALVDWSYPEWFLFVMKWGGLLFILISGICATLGSRSVRRGITVFLSGMIVTAVTVGMYTLNMAGRGIIIYYGVLHCLGTCMILWPVFRKLRPAQLLALGIPLVLVGWWLRGESFDLPLLMPLGFTFPGFSSSDYFPLMPNLGYFLLGAAFGKRFYAEKKTLLPDADPNHPVIRLFGWCGRNSLMIYLLHQPVLALGCEIFAMFVRR